MLKTFGGGAGEEEVIHNPCSLCVCASLKSECFSLIKQKPLNVTVCVEGRKNSDVTDVTFFDSQREEIIKIVRSICSKSQEPRAALTLSCGWLVSDSLAASLRPQAAG